MARGLGLGSVTAAPPPWGGRAPRHWQEPFVRLPARGSYVSMLRRHGAYELWTIDWDDKSEDAARAREIRLTVARGPSPAALGPPEVVQPLRPLLHDVTDPGRPGRPAAWRAMTRPHVIHEPGIGYVLFGCVTPEYRPGSVPLLPALAVSPDGGAGTWKYLGILQPEPRDESERRTRPVWTDGGGIVRLADGRWRVYLNGYVAGIAAAEADRLEGPWRFRRDRRGTIAVLCPQDGILPTVLRLADDEWHLWISQGWPVRAIHHWWSADGLRWRPYGRQPEITRGRDTSPAIKCLRAYADDGDLRIAGLLSIQAPWHGHDAWVLHQSHMPAGAPRA